MQLDDDTGLYLPQPHRIDLSNEFEEDIDLFDEKTCFYPATPLELFRDWRRVSKLGELGQDWTVYAAEKKFSPVYGREKEVNQIAEILRRRVKKNPILVGEAGVGKTAIIEALALRIINGEVPDWLKYKKIVSISLFDIIAQDKNYSFGEYAKRLKDIVNALTHQPNDREGWGRIAFFDEIHMLKEYDHAANFLKQYLARGEIQLIGATTLDEYRRYIERDPALERRFAPVFIDEPNLENTVRILFNLQHKLEDEYNISISNSAIKLAVELADSCIHDRHQPDKSIEVIDRACVRALNTSPNVDFELANSSNTINQLIVQEDHVRSIVSEWTGIPDSSLSGERQKYLNLERVLKKSLIGQDEAIDQITKTIITGKAGTVSRPQRPNGVFLFIGPTGVGKTQLAKSLALQLTGKHEHLVTLDMTGYRESYTIASLIGMPKGNDSTPQIPLLTKLVRDHPHGILLLDEVEKAHPEVLSLFMPVFEEGTLVDKQGTNIQFGNMTIIMIANANPDPLKKVNREFNRQSNGKSLTTKEKSEMWRNIYREELLKIARDNLNFSKEFLNRIDRIVPFYPLGQSHIRSILNLELSNMQQRLNIKLDLDAEAVRFLLLANYKKEFGARELCRTIDLYLGHPLAMIKLRYSQSDWMNISSIEVKLNLEETQLVLNPIRLR
jgi:ATP-dependent Clp protease ATP-binding subunit ClpC